MKVKVKDIHPNPFRHIDRYPIRADKVESLRKSIQTTGFWDNIVARVRDGRVEIAYGHHRWFALKEEYPPDHEVDLIIRDLSDEQMLKIMASENMEEWGSSVVVEHETVRAVVEAYAKGLIHLPGLGEGTPKSNIRYAPFFTLGVPDSGTHPYSAQSVAKFLGWTKKSDDAAQERVHDALKALSFIEEGILTEGDFDGLKSTQARVVIDQARRTKREREVQAELAEQAAERQRKAAEEADRRRAQAEEERRQQEEQAARAQEEDERQHHLAEAEFARQEAAIADQQRIMAQQRQQAATQKAEQERQKGREQAQKTARHVGQQISSGRIGHKQARQAANEVREKIEMPPPDIDQFALRVAGRINRMLDKHHDHLVKDLEELIRYQSYMSDHSREQLSAELEFLARRAKTIQNYIQKGRNDTPNGDSSRIMVSEVLQLT